MEAANNDDEVQMGNGTCQILLNCFIIIDLNDQDLNGGKIESRDSLEGSDQEERSDEESKSSKTI